MSAVWTDSEGQQVRDGDLVRFSYGIPPVGVEARVVDRDGELIALTPECTPKECKLRLLVKHVGFVLKVEPTADDPDEIEAQIFRRKEPDHA